ncbi:hypothetical protein M8C21_003084 [Ambrosia artemisiifolia]|uniref:Uncharacterized protein n=1 Tax=Ambrosia artemisiifolia TaxID=4212 RepID=A0AAD5D1B5_AMBAR|nr:hypothetical protein M8C21_003084 [Ambrosia artemisiifolia]
MLAPTFSSHSDTHTGHLSHTPGLQLPAQIDGFVMFTLGFTTIIFTREQSKNQKGESVDG